MVNVVILQGDRDPFGSKSDVAAYGLSEAVQDRWLPDGDHGFKPREASGRTEQENWQEGVEAVAEFSRFAGSL
jgi:predicted alpha/beta-hydrolase family hydrolase